MAVTFGRFHTDPDMHGLTTVAGLFHFSVDVRAHDPTVLSAVEAEFHRIVAAVEAEHHVRIHLGERKSAPVGLADPGIRAGLHRAARDMGVQAVDLGSPASHDAAAFAAAGGGNGDAAGAQRKWQPQFRGGDGNGRLPGSLHGPDGVALRDLLPVTARAEAVEAYLDTRFVSQLD